MTAFFSSVNKTVNLSGEELGDIFITYYGSKNFLSKHNDHSSGSYAFVVSLAAGPAWEPKFGGDLRFLCPSKQSACPTLGPSFNTLVLFDVRMHSVDHEVRRVLAVFSLAPHLPLACVCMCAQCFCHKRSRDPVNKHCAGCREKRVLSLWFHRLVYGQGGSTECLRALSARSYAFQNGKLLK